MVVHEGDLFCDSCELDSKCRFTVPLQARRDLAWLTSPGDALVALLDPGCALVLPASKAELVLERAKTLSARLAAGDSSAAESLLALQDRYRRVPIDDRWRVTLQLAIAMHLEPTMDTGRQGAVFIVRQLGEVELWGQSFRERRQASAPDFRELSRDRGEV
jgi:hypothetical protein